MNEILQTLSMWKIPFSEHCPIGRYSTFRIGRTARLAVFPKDLTQMKMTLAASEDAGVHYAVVGRGSNLLFPDGEYEGVLIFTTELNEINGEGEALYAMAGAPLTAVAIRARNCSLGGAEFAAGIPGSVGGAVLMNAGAFGGSMEQIVTYVDCYNTKTRSTQRFEAETHQFGYRTSRYAGSPHLILLGAGMRLQRRELEVIDGLMDDYLARRRVSQPTGFPNGGSVFKNPNGYSAGQLIEECGLKGFCIGGARVSEKHANFIINQGGATAKDVIELIDLIRQRVLEQTGIVLACELRGLGFTL